MSYESTIGIMDRNFLSDQSRIIRNSLQHRGLANMEKEYGRYMYVPLDVPRIEANDPQKFAEWYFSVAKPVRKIKNDIAGGLASFPHFLSVDAPHTIADGIWETNIRNDIFKVFPELAERIMLLPFKNIPRFSIWSSLVQVQEHRDHMGWLDLPMSFRSMLYDENPRSTLFLREDPIVQRTRNTFTLPRLEETNTFVWSNLRTVHGSTCTPASYGRKSAPALRKILLIFTNPIIDPKRFRTLLDASISRFHDQLFVSELELSDFVDL